MMYTINQKNENWIWPDFKITLLNCTTYNLCRSLLPGAFNPQTKTASQFLEISVLVYAVWLYLWVKFWWFDCSNVTLSFSIQTLYPSVEISTHRAAAMFGWAINLSASHCTQDHKSKSAHTVELFNSWQLKYTCSLTELWYPKSTEVEKLSHKYTVFLPIAAHAPIRAHSSNFEIISHKIINHIHISISQEGPNVYLCFFLFCFASPPPWSLQKNIEMNKCPPLMTLLSTLGTYWNKYST